jgi:hypothetical protein
MVPGPLQHCHLPECRTTTRGRAAVCLERPGRLHLVSGQSQRSGRASGRDNKEKQGPYRDGQGGAPCSVRRGIALPGSRFFGILCGGLTW